MILLKKSIHNRNLKHLKMLMCKKAKLGDYDKLNNYQEPINEIKFQDNLKQQINELLLFDHIICKKSSLEKKFIINNCKNNKIFININPNRNCSKINDKLKDLIMDETFKEGQFIFKIIDSWKCEKSNSNHNFYLWLSNLTLQKFIKILYHCNDELDFK